MRRRMPPGANRRRPRDWWDIAIWLCQVYVAGTQGVLGFLTTSQPLHVLVQMGATYVLDYPEALIRSVGTLQVLSAIGVLVPSLLRIMPGLTPASAAVVVVMQAYAIVFLPISFTIPGVLIQNLVLAALAAGVVWGRVWKRPLHAPRPRRAGVPRRLGRP